MDTRCRSVGLFGLISALMLLMYLASCGDSRTGSANRTFTVVVFSDVHFNPFYDPSLFQALMAADATHWADIFRTSRITGPSAWGSDTNYPLLVLALSSIRQNQGASQLIIFTGDILGHYLPQTFFGLYDPQNAKNPTPADVAAMKAFTDKTVAFFMEQVRSYAGNVPVMFTVGNADSYTGLGPDSSFLSRNAELYYSQFLNGSVNHQTFLETFTSGGYYSAEPAGLNVMVIGLNDFEFSPFFGDTTSGAVADELVWLDSILASARAAGKKVWLLMHVPPGADIVTTAKSIDAGIHITNATMMWNQAYQERFLQILSKYPGLITQTFTAHTHMDEYRIMSPNNLADTTPGITPYFGNNPAFKVFTFFSETLRSTDYISLNYDLATSPGQFSRYYTFSTAYHMKGFLSDALSQLYPELATDNAKRQLYRRSYFSGHYNFVPVGPESLPITDKTWPVYWCGIGHMDKQGLINCMNSY